MADDIRKSEVKLIGTDKWKFDFRENGYVIVSSLVRTTKGKKEEVKWSVGLHGVSIDACLQYVYSDYRGKCGVLDYDKLETV